ncbi:unnamed protein product [Euphydryas editha]|uniref:Reverse transcriptase domain-containing protein n=1 Tax=Euphydryas editha TaxID=104508 RepID=A0AAU9U345_EUPED|nr:unnamed protein product [Euphydryas editha]
MSILSRGEVDFESHNRKPANNRSGDAGWGGVLLAVRDQYKVQQVTDIDGYLLDIEVVIGIVTLNHKKIICSVVYIPPNSNDEKYINTFSLLENIVAKYDKLDFLIVGDFNLNSCSQNVLMQYHYLITFCELSQYNFICNKYNNTLDLVLSNLDCNWIEVNGDTEPVVPADAYHPPLLASRQSCSVFEYEGQSVAGKDAADAFAKYFSSVFLPDDSESSAENAEHETTHQLCSSRITVDEIDEADIFTAIRRLKAHSSAGPDGVPPYILKDCRVIFLEPLLFILNLALKTSSYPGVWKISRVTPVLKGGSGSKVENYRPIAVLSAFGKVFESILNKYITRQVQNQLVECQHGFRPGKSTTTNLINFVDYTVTEMDNNKQVDVAYFDFKKAFDRVQNDILLKKMSAIGFTPKLLKLFTNYFSNRVQYVQLSGHKSLSYKTSSGVSQGSTLGPTQFLIMINDLPKVVRGAECLMFADDLKLFFRIGSEHDCEILQADIDMVVKWGETNHLDFNSSKCKTMTFSRSRAPLRYNYRINGVSLERVTEIRDLGLTLDVNMTFNKHITNICSKAFQSLGFVLRQATKLKSRSAIIALYYSLVRSKLEYNSAVWDPHEQKYKLMIERVQRKFARYLYKRLYGYYPYLYPSPFVAGMVGINTLELRRKCALVMHYYLLLNNGIDNPRALARCSLFAPDRQRPSRPCATRCLLTAPPVRTQTAQYAPTSQAISLINDLIAQEPHIDIFFSRYKTVVKACVRLFSE